MRVKVFHNPNAGLGNHSLDEIRERLENEGYQYSCYSIKDDSYKEVLRSDPGDLVVVAGGDGTVKRVLKAIKFHNVPLAIFPIGTANNVANSFGIKQKEPIKISEADTKFINLGYVEVSGERQDFIEAVGVELIADMMYTMKNEVNYESDNEKIKRSYKVLKEKLLNAQEKELQVKVDGKDYSGRYIFVEVMNINFVGPNLFLTADAEPGDGMLDVVFMKASQREELQRYIDDRLEGYQYPLSFPFVKGKEVHLQGKNLVYHIDDSPEQVENEINIKIGVNERRVEVLTKAEGS